MAEQANQGDIERLLELIPQKPPFRFVNDIQELSADHIVAKYTLPGADAWIYQGHFPGRPVTPGVILIEIMAQTGVVALGIYNVMIAGGDLEQLTVFAECEIEFSKMVEPQTSLIVRGEKQFFRRSKLKSTCSIELASGEVVASGWLSGIGVKNET